MFNNFKYLLTIESTTTNAEGHVIGKQGYGMTRKLIRLQIDIITQMNSKYNISFLACTEQQDHLYEESYENTSMIDITKHFMH